MRLRTKILLIITVGIFCMIFLTSAILIAINRNALKENVEKSSALFAQVFSGQICEIYLRYYDSGFIACVRNIRDKLAYDEDIVDFAIYDMNGVIRLDNTELESGIKYTGPPRQAPSDMLSSIREMSFTSIGTNTGKGRWINMFVPYFDPWERHELTIRYTVSFQSLDAKIEKLVFTSLVVMFIFLAFGIVFAFILAPNLTRPIYRLVDGHRQIQQGNLDYRVSIHTKDEMQYLADGFNSMTAALKRNLRLITGIIESMKSTLITLSEDFFVEQWNTGAESLTGIARQNAIGKVLWDVYPHFGKFREACESVIANGEQEEMNYEKFANQPHRVYNITIYPLKPVNLSGIVIRMDDVTEIERVNEQIRQMQKAEIVSSLAGGLAHDFNNLIGGISGMTSLLEYEFATKNLQLTAEMKDCLDTIKSTATQAGAIVKHLLSLSRKQELDFETVDLCDMIHDVLKLCKNSLDNSVVIRFATPPTHCYVKADRVSIEQIVLNLCVNGAHAMTIMRREDEKWGGTLTLTLTPFIIDSTNLKIHPQAATGDYWKLSFADEGIGMDGETLSRIFDPFFTTKPVGLGSGLGLSMVSSLVEQHRGFIMVQSAKGIGTTFDIFLPKANEHGEFVRKRTELSIEMGNGSIVLCEEDGLMNKVTRKMLEKCGYTVLDAIHAAGTDASAVKPKLAVLDLTRGKISPVELVDRVKGKWGEIPYLLLVSYSMDEKCGESLNIDKTILYKPFDIEQFSLSVKKATTRRERK